MACQNLVVSLRESNALPKKEILLLRNSLNNSDIRNLQYPSIKYLWQLHLFYLRSLRV